MSHYAREPTECVNARWMESLHGFLRGIEWIMFHGHLDCFQTPPLGGRPNTKPDDHGSLNAHNHWYFTIVVVTPPRRMDFFFPENEKLLRILMSQSGDVIHGSVVTPLWGRFWHGECIAEKYLPNCWLYRQPKSTSTRNRKLKNQREVKRNCGEVKDGSGWLNFSFSENGEWRMDNSSSPPKEKNESPLRQTTNRALPRAHSRRIKADSEVGWLPLMYGDSPE